MSQCFRPVKEIWNTHSSCFVEPKALITLLHDLAARVGTASDEHSYGDNTSVWFENGRKVLDYIQSDNRFNAESFKDSHILIPLQCVFEKLPCLRDDDDLGRVSKRHDRPCRRLAKTRPIVAEAVQQFGETISLVTIWSGV
jgi:hypothetical protein